MSEKKVYLYGLAVLPVGLQPTAGRDLPPGYRQQSILQSLGQLAWLHHSFPWGYWELWRILQWNSADAAIHIITKN